MDAQTIINDTNSLIEKLDNNLILLNEKCVEYIQEYEQYTQSAIYDGTILKNKMKSAVIQAVPNDI